MQQLRLRLLGLPCVLVQFQPRLLRPFMLPPLLLFSFLLFSEQRAQRETHRAWNCLPGVEVVCSMLATVVVLSFWFVARWLMSLVCSCISVMES